MAIEKNMSGGRRVSTPLGVGLLAWGFAIVAANTGAIDLLGTMAG